MDYTSQEINERKLRAINRYFKRCKKEDDDKNQLIREMTNKNDSLIFQNELLDKILNEKDMELASGKETIKTLQKIVSMNHEKLEKNKEIEQQLLESYQIIIQIKMDNEKKADRIFECEDEIFRLNEYINSRSDITESNGWGLNLYERFSDIKHNSEVEDDDKIEEECSIQFMNSSTL